MEIFPYVMVALFGLVAGSFLNVVVLRHNTGRSVNGRSSCMSCGCVLGPLDLVPVLSWIFLRGRCRRCEAKVSWQYPLVEMGGAGAFLLAYAVHPFLGLDGVVVEQLVAFALSALALAALLAIVAYDLRHKIIPDRFSAFLAAAALARIVFLGVAWDVPLEGWGIALAAGPITALPLFLLWAVSRGRWMGLGDPKLALGLGWLLGASGGILTLFLAFLSGAVIGVGLLLVERLRGRSRHSMRSELPFAPFLALGAAVAFGTGWGVPDLLQATAWLTAPLLGPVIGSLL